MADERFYESQTKGVVRSAPAALRNRDPIADVLADWLPRRGLVLEIASGTGEHIVHFAKRFPDLDWQPTDIHPDALASITSRRAETRLSNVGAPLVLDAASSDWPVSAADAVLSINMVHISRWQAARGLLDGARKLLPLGGPLILYGPWLSDETETATSNLEFDRDLRRRNPDWGLRRVEEFTAEASERGFSLEETRSMPANNLMILFKRS